MTTPNPRALAERLLKLAEKATRGRWFIQGGHNDYALYGNPQGSENGWTLGDHILDLDSYKMKPSAANAEWMAAANPEDVIALARYALDRGAGWQPIETAPKGRHILYFPAQRDSRGRNLLMEDIRVDYYPVHYPRKPTLWMPLPAPPQDAQDREA